MTAEAVFRREQPWLRLQGDAYLGLLDLRIPAGSPMPRLVAVSLQQYRLHDIEITDLGPEGHVVLVRPPPGRGEPVELKPEGPRPTLAHTIGRARTLIDAVMGPKPPPRVTQRRR